MDEKTTRWTLEEEQELVRRGQSGDIEARNQVIMSMDSLCWREAARFGRGDKEKINEIHNYAIQVLCEKFDQYQWYRGFRFNTWAFNWVNQAVRTYWTRVFAGTVRIPDHLHNDPIAAKKRKQYIDQAKRTVSISEEFSNGSKKEFTVADLLEDHRERPAIDEISSFETITRVNEAMKCLPPKYAQVLISRRDKTLDEIGAVLGVSRERVRQLETRAEEKFFTALQRLYPEWVEELETESREFNHSLSSFEKTKRRRLEERSCEMSAPVDKKAVLEEAVRKAGATATYKDIREQVLLLIDGKEVQFKIHDCDISVAKRAIFGESPVKRQAKSHGHGEELGFKHLLEIKGLAEQYGGIEELDQKISGYEAIEQFSAKYGGIKKLKTALSFMRELAGK